MLGRLVGPGFRRFHIGAAVGVLLGVLPGVVSAHGGIEELDPRIVGPTIAVAVLLFLGLFGFMLTGPAWLLGLPEETTITDDRVVPLPQRQRNTLSISQESSISEEEGKRWRGRSAG